VWYVLGFTAGGLAVWYAIAAAWASSVSKHNPDLREGAGQLRYGWRCPRCGNMEAPACSVNRCGGPLVWVQRNTRIKCARCHRSFVPHPMLFRVTPRARFKHCRKCGWRGKITDFKLD